MPKRYTDSLVHALHKYDQLKIVFKAQHKELTTARVYTTTLEQTIVAKDSLHALEIQPYKKREKTLLGVLTIETILLLLIIL